MAKIVMEEAVEFPVLPEDSIVLLKVSSTETFEITGDRPWTKLNFDFKVMQVMICGDGGSPARFDSLVGDSMRAGVPFRLTDHADNKLKQWVEAILGMELGVGFELDTDYLNGRVVRGVTGTYERRNAQPDPKTGKKPLSHTVVSLLPYKTNGAAGAGSGFAAPSADPWASTPAPAPAGDPWATGAAAEQGFYGLPASTPQVQTPVTTPAPAPTPAVWDDEPPF